MGKKRGRKLKLFLLNGHMQVKQRGESQRKGESVGLGGLGENESKPLHAAD